LDAAEIKEALAAAGLKANGPTRLGNDLGDQVRVKGAVVNVFDNGTVQVQGTADVAARVRDLLGMDADGPIGTKLSRARTAEPRGQQPGRVCGVWTRPCREDAVGGNAPAMELGGPDPRAAPLRGNDAHREAGEYARDDVRFGVVLATPDDVGNAVGKDDERKHRARQNVVLELGLLLAKLGRPRVAILLKNQATMERPSDLQGLIYMPFTDDVDEVKLQLAKEMHKQGIAIDLGRV
jgi:predicted nucleotide-binding protein